ncbi:MAG: glucoamylase family protein, partial [Verrucomicrobiota bacterium]
MPSSRGLALLLAGFLAEGPGALAALPPAPTPAARSTEEFLDVLQRTAFQYFWEQANPVNGLVRDRSTASSKCSIAATGFGLSAILVGIDRGWITREAGRERVRATLRTLARLPQGPAAGGVAGHRGWFYHFLEMETGLRTWKCELSSIDTALLLAGVLDAAQYFGEAEAGATEIRRHATFLLDRIDWHWMRNGAASLAMGWHPEKGFIGTHWVGYNEAMILYLLGLGAGRRPLDPSAWDAWTAGYVWTTQYGQSFVEFPPLFGHQYSHVWV